MTDGMIYLGQLLTDPTLIASSTLKESDFLDPKERRVFRAIHGCLAKNIEPDILTVHDFDPNISPSYLAGLTSGITTTKNWKYYHDKVKEESNRLKVRKLGEAIAVDNKSEPIKETIAYIEKVLMDIATENSEYRPKNLKELIPGFIDTLEARYKNKGEYPGITVSINSINDAFLGFQKQMLYYIGARPSQGKSALLLNFAVDMVSKDIPVGYFSAESSFNEVLTRLYAQEGKLNSRSLMTGFFSERHFHRLTDVSSKFYEKNMFIYDKPNMSLSDVIVQAKFLKRKHDIKALFIDYVQIISDPTYQTKRERIEFVSIALKNLARELDIPVIVAAQLRRDAENRKPTLADFSDSSQIEKDADGVIMIYHPENKSFLCVEKARDGATGVLQVFYKGEFTRFYEKETI